MDDRIRDNVEAALVDLSAVLREVCADRRGFFAEDGALLVQYLRHVMYCAKLLSGIVAADGKNIHNDGAGGVVILPDVLFEEQEDD